MAYRTYIGVLSQPMTPYDRYVKNFSDNYSFIAASYVKFVEDSGAQSVLIPYDLPLAEIQRLMRNLNGIVLPGGGAALFYYHDYKPSGYMNKIYEIIKYAKKLNDDPKVGFFSVWGTCLGFEALMISLACFLARWLARQGSLCKPPRRLLWRG